MDAQQIAETQLDDLAIGYLQYLAMDKVYNCGRTFQQIVEIEYNGDMDLGFWDFHYNTFRHIQINTITQVLIWVFETHNIRLNSEQESRLLFKIKEIVITNTFNEIREKIGLCDIDLK